MKSVNHKMPYCGSMAIIGLMLLIAFNPLSAQQSAQYDNTVGLVPPGWSPVSAPQELITVTDEEGFDNFFLGIDFAEPHMSSNPLNPLEYFNAWNTNSTHYTYDGHDWITSTGNFGGFPLRGDPVTAYDSLGNLYYENMYGSPNIIGCQVIRSTDNGATWFPTATAISGVDKNWIACDQTAGPFANYVYTTMTAGSGQGHFARSTDFGASFQNTYTFFTQSLPGMMVAVGPDVLGGNDISGGCVYVVTNSGNTTSPVYTFYLSTDGGTSFTLRSSQGWANYVGTIVNNRHSVENMRTRPYPFIAADNSRELYRGRLYCVYANNTPIGNGNKPDIFCRYSDNQGLSWSSAILINDDLNTTSNHQWHPAIWCDKETGRQYAHWMDTRDVITSDSCDIYASYSDDGGVTWAPNIRLTTERMKIDCSSCGGGGTPRYQGDYNAVTSNRYSAMAVWTDFRFGTFGSYTAYLPDFAMKISKSVDTLRTTDSMRVVITVPAIKLYEHSVKFSATVSPAANFSFNFPQGDSLAAFPDSLVLDIHANGVPEDNYEVIIQGEGPNGTPVHRRYMEILVTDGFLSVIRPNGGEVLYSGTSYPITWENIFVDSVKLEYSTDAGSSWVLIAETAAKPSEYHNPVHPKLHNVSTPNLQGELSMATYDWIVPSTMSTQCLVRVSDKSGPSVFDVSDATFSIIPAPAASWRTQTSGTTASLLSVSVLDTSIAYIGGLGGTVLRTFDGGQSWTTTGSVGGDVYNIFSASQFRIFAAVNDATSARIRRSFNGGIGWQTSYEDTTSGAFINAIWMFDESNGYAMGDPVNGQWTLLRTTNGGTTWDNAASLPQAGSEAGWNNSMYWMDDQIGWFGTNNSRVYYTTDGGSSWSPANTSFSNSFGVSFANDLTGMAAGNGTDLSTDGGNTWSGTPGQIPGDVFALSGLNLNPLRWYLVSGSDVYKTSDQGTSFSVDFSQGNAFNHIDMKLITIGDYDWICGYAVGENGTINKYLELPTVTDISDVSGNYPAQFALQQNYPNPFNPSTTIKFKLPVRAHVTLKVVNLLGQEVATLMDSRQNSGDIEIEWDGKNSAGNQVASGIYFYQLVAKGLDGEQFNSIRRMVLIK
jgi:photosystem II stability/assembly factor-like uncharacterized protein